MRASAQVKRDGSVVSSASSPARAECPASTERPIQRTENPLQDEPEAISLGRRLKYRVLRGLHRLLSMYPYDDGGRGVDGELALEVRREEEALVVTTSRIPGAGLGLFSDRDYEPGELVCTYVGTPLTLVQMLRTRDWTYLMDCGKDSAGRRVHLDARHHPRIKAAFINHQSDRDRCNLFCDALPDAHKCLMIASRHITRGEELYIDYGPKYWHVVTRGKPASAGSALGWP